MNPLTRLESQPTAPGADDAAHERAQPEATRASAPGWEPPRVLWEQELVALTQVSQPPCIPGQDPRCS